MRRLMITCPETQKPLPTGISMDEATFTDPTSRLGHHATSCPHCQGVHRWSKADAVLEPAPPTWKA
jgi:hypothetical protein